MTDEKPEETQKKRDIIKIMNTIDRRIIFLLIALAIILPLVFHLVFTVRASPIVEAIFDKVESLPPGSKVILSFDYGPSTVPENQPMAEAVARHVLHKDLKLYMMAVWATGPPQIDLVKSRVVDVDFPKKVYGKDWINLGYKAGNQGLINAILLDLKGMYTTDIHGTPIDDFEMMRDVANLTDMSLIVCIGSGYPGMREWVQFAGDPGRIPVCGGVTAVEAPLLYPYYPRQLLGLMGGLQGAAEYEATLVTKYPQFIATSEQAVKLMGPQTVAHLVIISFVIIGNIAFFAEKGRQRKGKKA
ncbi:MAG: hypothetical protein QME66_07075 [Candidatus Eisenbacteria bacterium]|nr:hypothetical protein [Candidatus Eisenbacteria bacterium]